MHARERDAPRLFEETVTSQGHRRGVARGQQWCRKAPEWCLKGSVVMSRRPRLDLIAVSCLLFYILLHLWPFFFFCMLGNNGCGWPLTRGQRRLSAQRLMP